MDSFDLYKDISERTKGDIYIGAPVIIRLSQQSQQISGFDGLVLFFYTPKRVNIV